MFRMVLKGRWSDKEKAQGPVVGDHYNQTDLNKDLETPIIAPLFLITLRLNPVNSQN